MGAAISMFPVVINGTTIFMIQWLSLTVFLVYGLLAEVLIVQYATVFVMLITRVGFGELYRYALNSLMFFITSVTAAAGFFLAGGTIGAGSLQKLWLPALAYIILYFLANQLLLYGFSKFLKRNKRFFGKDAIWEAIILVAILPLALGLYALYVHTGPVSLVLIGVPFVGFAMVLRMYNSSEKINDYLQKAAEIGHELTERLNVDEVMDLFIQKISNTLPVDYAYILDAVEDELVLLRRVENGVQLSNDISPLKKSEGISGFVWAAEKSYLFHDRSEWAGYAQGYIPDKAESILCVPIMRGQNVEGVLFLASTRKKMYEKFQLAIIDILCSYFAVAIMNARHYEKTKSESERCALTSLHNYRYFEQHLSEKFEDLHAGRLEKMSLIMLDIDHFKSVNDTYGHQAGNEILVKMASRLSDLIGDRGLLARYGGEEFVVLLPDTDQKIALRLAETIRTTIANRPFIVRNDLGQNFEFVEVNITASIGVATAPENADDGMALIRHADRALYIGAKQAGRNRVAEYVK